MLYLIFDFDFPAVIFHICNFDICHDKYKYQRMKISVSCGWVCVCMWGYLAFMGVLAIRSSVKKICQNLKSGNRIGEKVDAATRWSGEELKYSNNGERWRIGLQGKTPTYLSQRTRNDFSRNVFSDMVQVID